MTRGLPMAIIPQAAAIEPTPKTADLKGQFNHILLLDSVLCSGGCEDDGNSSW
jgi:hypothetical protein